MTDGVIGSVRWDSGKKFGRTGGTGGDVSLRWTVTAGRSGVTGGEIPGLSLCGGTIIFIGGDCIATVAVPSALWE